MNRRCLAVIPLILIALTACEKKPTATTEPINTESAATFDRVAAELDTGGDIYVYLRTEQILATLPATLTHWQNLIWSAMEADAPIPRDQYDDWCELLTSTVTDTGLFQLSAIGLSAIELPDGLTRTRSFAYAADLEQPGLLWRLGGSPEPHPITALEFLPASTIYAAFTDFDPEVLWSFVKQTIDAIPDQTFRTQALVLPATFEAAVAMSLSDFFASLGNEFGLVITADDSTTMQLPTGTGTAELPLLRGALLITVNDDQVYDLVLNRLETTLGSTFPVTKSDEDGVRSAVADISGLGLPIKPTLARFGNYLAIASDPELISQLAGNSATPSPLLKDSPAFQRFAQREPLEANSFGYLSDAGADILKRFQLASIHDDPTVPPALRTEIERLYDAFGQKATFGLGRLQPDGFASVAYSESGSEQIVAALAIIPVALVAALAVPAVAAALSEATETDDPAPSGTPSVVDQNAPAPEPSPLPPPQEP